MRAPLLLTLALVGLTALLGAAAGAQGMVASFFAAHRGGALLWPENSLLAFRNATAMGADYLEMDVHLTRDGEVVVIHDPTLDRTSTGAGPVRDRTLAELASLRLKDRGGVVTEERIPTLDQVVALAAAGKRQMLLEIKVDAQRRRYPDIEEKVFAVLDRHAFLPFTIVMAFEPDTWRRVRQLRPEARAGALYSARMLPASHVEPELQSLRAAGVAFVGLNQALVNAQVATQARLAGLALGVWTVNERDAIERFIGQGVSVVITDRPDLAKELLGR
ncbi:MAG: glycerophosphodiester phosphodiesterase [Candidatus Rokuibacteriota bacterium]